MILMIWNFSDALLFEGSFMIAFELLLSAFFILQPQQHSCYFTILLIATLTHVTIQGSSAYDLPWIFLFGLVKMAYKKQPDILKNQIGIQLQALHVTFKCIMTTLKGQGQQSSSPLSPWVATGGNFHRDQASLSIFCNLLP